MSGWYTHDAKKEHTFVSLKSTSDSLFTPRLTLRVKSAGSKLKATEKANIETDFPITGKPGRLLMFISLTLSRHFPCCKTW